MAQNKKGFVLYADQIELFSQLSDEQAGRLIKHIYDYVNDNNPMTDDMITNLAFTPIKQQLKRDLSKWETRAGASRINGSKGGRPKKEPRKPTGLNNNLDKPRKPVTVTVKDTVNVTVKDTDIKYKKYEPFSLELINKYFKGINIDTKPQVKAIRDLVEIDGYTKEKILSAVRNGRGDSFWSKNFLSLTKLRKPNKDGVKHIEVFNQLTASTQVNGFYTP